MPVHEWPQVPAGLFHHFHRQWAGSVCNALNSMPLPNGLFALLEPQAGIAVAEAPPKTRFVSQASDEDLDAAKADRIAIYNPLGGVVSVIELVSPGNNGCRHALRSFVEKTLDFLRQGVHVLVVDLFPRGPCDPHGIHKVIWDEVREEPFELPADKPLTLAAYAAGLPKRAYVEPVAVGGPLPDMPAFLGPDTYILVPLEATYLATWNECPEPLRQLISTPIQ
jgi:hypothetical protein